MAKSIKTYEDFNSAYNSPFATKLREVLARSPKTGEKVTYKMLAEYLHVKQQSVSAWATGTTTPELKHLTPIADYFGVSVDYLLKRTTDKDGNADVAAVEKRFGFTKKEQDIFEEQRKLFANTKCPMDCKNCHNARKNFCVQSQQRDSGIISMEEKVRNAILCHPRFTRLICDSSNYLDFYLNVLGIDGDPKKNETKEAYIKRLLEITNSRIPLVANKEDDTQSSMQTLCGMLYMESENFGQIMHEIFRNDLQEYAERHYEYEMQEQYECVSDEELAFEIEEELQRLKVEHVPLPTQVTGKLESAYSEMGRSVDDGNHNQEKK